MREIKYKAWLGEKMIDVDVIEFKEKRIGYHIKDGYGTCPFEHCKLLEFTGLKDKNKKEIYAGDIVELKNYNHDEVYKKAEIRTEGITYKAYVGDEEWDNGYTYEDWSDNWENCEHIIVIGNIFEDKDLLTK